MTTLWSFNYIVAKFALREFPPLLASSLRTCIAGLIMLPIYAIYNTRGEAGWNRSDLSRLISLGMLGVALNQVFFVVGIAHTSVAHAAIMIALTPVLVLLIASATGQERLQPGKFLGLLIAMSGVVIVQLASGSDRTASFLGDVLVFGAAVTFAIFSVNSKRSIGQIKGVTLNTFAYVGSGIALAPVVLWQGSGFAFLQVSWLAWLSVVYMALFSSVLCYVIYHYALTYIPASRVAAFSYLQPLLATLMAIPVLGEHPTRSLVLGGSLVLLGVFLVERA